MTQRIKLIGLTGYRGTGKDTVASVLSGHGFQRYALAGPIKSALILMFRLNGDAFEDRSQKESVLPDIGASPRYLAQTLGTEWGRRLIADDLWVRVMRRQVEALMADSHGVVITDVRFDNEAKAIRDMGGAVIRVKRPSVDIPMARAIHRTRLRRWLSRILSRVGVDLSPGVHPSELGVSDDLIDAAIVNDRSLRSLADAVDGLVEDLDIWDQEFLDEIRRFGMALPTYRAA